MAEGTAEQKTQEEQAKEHWRSGNVLFQNSNFNAAKEEYTRAIEIKDDYVNAYFNRALCEKILNEPLTAINDLEKVMLLQPDSYDAPFLMGSIHESLNDLSGARYWYEKALSKNPNFSEAKNSLEGIYKRTRTDSNKGSKGVEVEMSKPKEPLYKKANEIDSKLLIDTTQSFSRSKTNYSIESTTYKAEVPNLNFSDVAGLESLKEELTRRVIYPLQKPELVSEYGFKGFGGLLIYGPPGCGKTVIIRATAGEAKVKLIEIHIPEILESHVGDSEKNIREAFANARKSAPCILFFDELEALLTNRAMARYTWDISIVNVFLKELDDLSKSEEHVLVMGATNAPWLVDPAAKRPGRFDKLIYVPAPKKDTRKELFIMYLKGKPLDNDINYEKLAEISAGYSPADIAMICNEATIQALDEAYKTGTKRRINMHDIKEVISKTKQSLSEWYDTAAKEVIGKDKELYADLVDEISEYQKERDKDDNKSTYR